jgi:hypothetical protein
VNFAVISRLFCAALLATSLAAGEAGAEAAKPEQAKVLYESGMQAMADSNSTPSRIIDAAMDFTAALKLYESAEDFDKCQEMQANIFWCKKRMNLDDLNTYLAKKKNDKSVSEAMDKMTAIADQVVDVAKATEYFDRAKKFAAENPDKHLEVTMRYFEVAERFQGAKIGLEAQKLSMAAQAQWMAGIEKHIEKQVADREQEKRDTLFTKPAQNATEKRLPAPDAAAQKASALQVKKMFKDEPRVSKGQKQSLGWKIFELAKGTNDDPALRFGMYTEAIQLAQAANDVHGLIIFIDEQARAYEGVDAAALKKDNLTRIKSYEAAGAVLKLLESPLDPDANTKAGKYWCFIAHKWDLGLPLLFNGGDKTLARVAELEIASPSGSMQQVEVGDLWYDAAEGFGKPYKELSYDRARHWYKLAQQTITGASKAKVERRLEEIFGIIADPTVDFNSLNEKQWDKLKGTLFEVNGAKSVNDSKVSLKPGQKVRVVPHPSDKWKANDGWNNAAAMSFDWKGDPDMRMGRRASFNFMAMVCWVEKGPKSLPGILEGPGKVFLCAEDPYQLAAGGTIRVKLMILDEE